MTPGAPPAEPPRSAGRNALAMAASQLLGRAFLLVGFIVAARAAGPAAFGQLNVALGLLALLGLIADPGLYYVGQRAVVATPDDARPIIATVLALKVILACVVAGGAAVAHVIAGTTVSFLVLCYALTLIPAAIGLGWALGGREHFAPVALANVMSAAAHALWIVIFVRGPGDVFHVAVGLFVANAIAAWIQRRWMRHPNGGGDGPRWQDAAQLLRQGLPFAALLALSQLLVWLDSFLLAALLDARAVGVYHAAYRWVLLTLAIATYFPQALFPRMLKLRESAQGLRLLEEAVRLSLMLGPLATFLLFIAAPLLVVGGFGREYAEARTTLCVLALLVPFAMHNGLVVHHLNARGRERSAVVIAATVVAVNAVLNVVFIRRWSTTGAAAAMVATEAASFALCTAALARTGFPMRAAYGGFMVGLLGAVGASWLLPGALWLRASAATCAFLLAQAATGGFSRARLAAYHEFFWKRS